MKRRQKKCEIKENVQSWQLLSKIWLNINMISVSVIIKLPHEITNFMLSYLNPTLETVV